MKREAKLITIIISLILCISVIGSAFALYTSEGSLIINFEGVSSTPTTVTLYYFNIYSWDSVYAYVWDSTGNYNKAYPGETMTAVNGQDGWYSIEVSNGYANVLFNSNDDSKKTDNLTVDGSNLYFDGYQWNNDFNEVTITVNSSTSYPMTASHTSDTTVASQYTASVYLNEGDKVTISDNKGYSYTSTSSAWQNSTDFSGTAPYAGEYTFYAKRDYDGNPLIWTGIPTITVYYYNVLDWSTVKAHTWGSTIETYNTTWAGSTMTAVDGHSKWYSITIAKDCANIIFNNNGSSQTPNLDIDTEKLYFNGYEWTNGFNLYTATTRRIYFKNTANWSNVYCHHWNSSTGTTWPGDKMTSLGNGWYYVDIKTSDTYVIFHNYSGTQTADISITHYNWYYDYSRYYTDNLAYGWVSSMD